MKIDVSLLSKYNCKIKTDSGYQVVTETFIKSEKCYELHFSDWTILKVAENHLFELSSGEWKFAKDLADTDVVLCEQGEASIINKIDVGMQTVYDLTVDTNKHQYYLDGISSHNTGKNLIISSACCALMDRKSSPYEGIVYIRSNIDSIETKDQELGFLPGPQPLWAKVLTPNGWTTMGELDVGDEVIGKDGLPHKVLKTFNKGIKDIYRISTTTGKVAYSCEDHLWSTQNYNEHKHNKPFQIRTLKEIRETLLYKNGKINHYLPRNDVIHYNEQKELPIPPYVLGCLLGDGSMRNNSAISFHNVDTPIIDRVHEELLTIGAQINYHSHKGISYVISNIDATPNKPSRRIKASKGKEDIIFETRMDCERYFNIDHNKIVSLCDRPNSTCEHDGWVFERLNKNVMSTNIVKNKLHSLGILGCIHKDKYVPEMYMRSSVEERLNLLRGLLDTDGHAHNRGQAYFTTVSTQLRDDVVELVRSLGGSTYINSRDRRDQTHRKLNGRPIKSNYISYTIGISIPNMNPFYLDRKANRYNTHIKCFYLDRISEITLNSTEEAKCILLDSEDHLYITDDFMVTHNTMDDKMAPYLRPLKDTIDTLVRSKYKVAISKDREALDAKIEEFNEKYNISFEAMNFLRGGTIKNSLIIIDECLSEGSILHTEEGKMSIETIVSKISKGESIKVLSYNFNTNAQEMKALNNIKVEEFKPDKDKMYEIELEDGGMMAVTGNHKLYINGEYRKVGDCLDDSEYYLLKDSSTNIKITSIKEVHYKGKIYTPEVEDNHNYFLGESMILSKNCQNISVSGMKLILTRVGENCKVFIMGDTQQIDSKYMSERNNGLTYMMNLVGTQEDIRIVGIDLTKTIRSKIAGWAADNM